MEVRAIKDGFINHRYQREGTVFEIKPVKGLDMNRNPKVFSEDEQFSKKWMEKVSEDEEIMKPKSKKKEESKPIALSKLNPNQILPSDDDVI